jgi:hypothetical protein
MVNDNDDFNIKIMEFCCACESWKCTCGGNVRFYVKQ